MLKRLLSSDRGWKSWRAAWWISAGLIFAWGAWIRFSLPQLPLVVPDSNYYLTPAVAGGDFRIGPRTFVYPAFCELVLALGRDWRSIPVAQHLLGLAGPALLLGAWSRLGAAAWRTRPARAGHDAVGLLVPLLLLPSTAVLIQEQQVLLETLNSFLQCLLGALFCLTWGSRGRRRLGWASLTAAFGAFMYFSNPRWGAALPTTVALCAWAVLLDERRRRLPRAGAVLGAAACAFAALYLVQKNLVYQDRWNDSFTAKHLLWMHADLAVNEFRRDLAGPLPPERAALLRKLVAKIDKEIVGRGASHWATLTFNADAMMYPADNPDENVMKAYRNDPDGYIRFLLHYYLRIIRHQPRAYLGIVRRMLGWYYCWHPTGNAAFREFQEPLSEDFAGSAPCTRVTAGYALPGPRQSLERAAGQMQRLAQAQLSIVPPWWYQAAVAGVGLCFLPVELAGVAAAGCILLSRRLRGQPGTPLVAGFCLSVALAHFAQVLTLSMVTVTEGRYADALRALAALTLAAAIAAVAAAILGWRDRGAAIPATSI